MRELHLFAGAGGGILGGVLLGHRCVCAVEIDPACRQILLQRQRDGVLPRFPIWDDVRTFDGTPWRGLVDIVAGGFPCQDISVAGNGTGITGKRSGLWREQARIIREVRPRYVFVENSPALLERGMGVVLADLSEMGFDARWGVISAESAGAPHARDRLWIVGNHADPDHADREHRPRSESREARTENCEVWRRGLGELVAERITDRFTSYSSALRILSGMADRVDRLSAVGNGQVPAVAALAWHLLGEKQYDGSPR